MNQTIFTMGQAAKAVGYAKSKISSDIKSGKLSATREDVNGSYQIDASELIRVYGARFKPERLADRSRMGTEDPGENDREHGRTPENGEIIPNKSDLNNEIVLLKERLAMATTLHEAEVRQLSARIEDMRASVEDAHGQRDRAMALLTEQIAVTRQLTDQRAKDAPIPMPGPLADVAAPAVPAAKAGRGWFGLVKRRSN